MTRANTEQLKHTPWFAKAGAACSIVPIARFVGPNIFTLKGGGYGCLFSLTGIDEEGFTDQELESRMRSIEGSLRGLPEGSCLYQYTRVMSGFDLPRQAKYANPATEVFASDRLTFLENTAGFRRIDLHWCLTLEPSKVKAFERKPQENAVDTSRMLADLEKTATILQSHLGNAIGLRLQGKDETFQFFSYLFNLEEWAERDQLRSDTGVDRQIVKTPIAWHSDYLQVGKRHVQMFSLKTTPEASRPCLFSDLLRLDCDSVLCSTWRVKSSSSARSEIDAQEKFISFFKVGVLTRVMSGRDIDLDARDSMTDAELSCLGVQRANVLCWCIAFHDDTRLDVQFRSKPQQCLCWKLPYIKAGIEFGEFGHRWPAHTARHCHVAAVALRGGFLRGTTLLGLSAKRCRSTSIRACVPVKTVFSSHNASEGWSRNNNSALLFAQECCVSNRMLDCVRSDARR
jgi:hypothetical protein